MVKIDFEHFPLVLNASGSKVQEKDVRESLADIICTQASGVKAHSLMHRIYESSGMQEYDDNDINIIMSIANSCCLVCFISSIERIINNQK